jgi:hypothetical protein
LYLFWNSWGIYLDDSSENIQLIGGKMASNNSPIPIGNWPVFKDCGTGGAKGAKTPDENRYQLTGFREGHNLL